MNHSLFFYDPKIQRSSTFGPPFLHTLNAEGSWHGVKVLRMQIGDNIAITDGRGTLFSGFIKSLNPKACEIEITGQECSEETKHQIHIGIAPVKNMSRLEWFLEKATEIGVDQITPILCSRSEKITVRTDRLNKIITAALKQSLGVFRPRLNETVSLPDFLETAGADQKFIAWCGTQDEPLLSQVCLPDKKVIVLIGPEGDFTTDEVIQAKNNAFIPISLGKNRLRTETAALLACATIHFVNRSF